MLTALYIKKEENDSALSRFFKRLRGDSLKVDIKSAGTISVKCVEYISRKDKINWRKIDKAVLAQRNRLLCSEELTLPKNLGYKRFDCSEYKHRLCTNVAVCLLCSMDCADIKVGLFDLDASYTTLIKYLTKYVNNLVVVTKSLDEYTQVADILLEETGVPLRISKNSQSLCDCDLIIAPDSFEYTVNTKREAVILTDKKPEQDVLSTVVYDYVVKLPDVLKDLCPTYIDDTYFACALYTVMRMYQLGSLVPQLCVSVGEVHTISSLKTKLIKLCDKT